MHATQPHFLLFSSADPSAGRTSRWQFVLESIDGASRFAAGDEEPQAPSERAELLAVVRGLEALDQPSRVTLVTRSRYVLRGLSKCLDDWRASQWQWECFGRLEPIRDHDLWQRVDRALAFHRVDCHTWPANEANELDGEPAITATPGLADRTPVGADDPAVLIVRRSKSRRRRASLPKRLLAACDAAVSGCGDYLAAFARSLVPLPRST